MSKSNFKLDSKKYQIYKGVDWPSFDDYQKDNISKEVALEIKKIEDEEQLIYQNLLSAQINANTKKHTISFKSLSNYFIITVAPALVSLFLFFYLEGIITKFIVLFLIFRFLNIMWDLTMHRWLCHYQFVPKKWARPFLLYIAAIGSSSHLGQWLKSHTAHHKDMDTEIDPYPSSWGLLNLLVFRARYHKQYPFGRWMLAKDIKFVMRNFLWIRTLHLVAFLFIDIHVVLMYFIMNWYDKVVLGLTSYYYHDGSNTTLPVDKYPFLGYPIIIFMGIEWVHFTHHSKPWLLNFAQDGGKYVDIGYYLIRPFADIPKKFS